MTRAHFYANLSRVYKSSPVYPEPRRACPIYTKSRKAPVTRRPWPSHLCAIPSQIAPLFSTTSNIPISNPFPFRLMRTTPVSRNPTQRRRSRYLLQNHNVASHDELTIMESKRYTKHTGVGGQVFLSTSHRSRVTSHWPTRQFVGCAPPAQCGRIGSRAFLRGLTR